MRREARTCRKTKHPLSTADADALALSHSPRPVHLWDGSGRLSSRRSTTRLSRGALLADALAPYRVYTIIRDLACPERDRARPAAGGGRTSSPMSRRRLPVRRQDGELSPSFSRRVVSGRRDRARQSSSSSPHGGGLGRCASTNTLAPATTRGAMSSRRREGAAGARRVRGRVARAIRGTRPETCASLTTPGDCASRWLTKFKIEGGGVRQTAGRRAARPARARDQRRGSARRPRVCVES